MTVKQLIAKLKKLPQNARVIMVKDGEANGASPLAVVQTDFYRADSTGSGDIKHPDDKERGDKTVVSLWPVY